MKVIGDYEVPEEGFADDMMRPKQRGYTTRAKEEARRQRAAIYHP